MPEIPFSEHKTVDCLKYGFVLNEVYYGLLFLTICEPFVLFLSLEQIAMRVLPLLQLLLVTVVFVNGAL